MTPSQAREQLKKHDAQHHMKEHCPPCARSQGFLAGYKARGQSDIEIIKNSIKEIHAVLNKYIECEKNPKQLIAEIMLLDEETENGQ